MKVVGYMVVGAGEADRHLDEALSNMKSLTDDAIVVLNQVDEKTRQMVERSGFRSYSDDREWGLFQPAIKEDLVKRAYGLHPDWFLCMDADEKLDVTREKLDFLMDAGENAWYTYVTQLWDDREHWKPEISFWNIRFWKARKDMGVAFERKPLHCGLAPAWTYHYGWYAPCLLIHYGLMDKENRKRKADRYRQYDPNGKWKPASWYKWLDSSEPGVPLDKEAIITSLMKDSAFTRRRKPTMHMPKPRSFVFLRREDGVVIDIPSSQLDETLKHHPTWEQVTQVNAEDSEGDLKKAPPPLIEDPLECGICGEKASTEAGLKVHKTRKHKVRASASSETSTV